MLQGHSETELDPLPEQIKSFKFWQLGFGEHASTAKPIITSTMLEFIPDQGRPIQICHIIVDGSSPWLLGRNITRLTYILHVNGNCLCFPAKDGTRDTMTIVG